MSKELKPCPFCGGEPEIVRRAGAFGVKCTCSGKRFVTSYGKTEEAAVLSWNVRYFKIPPSVMNNLSEKDAELSKLREENERLREAMKQIAEMANWQIGVPTDTEAANEHARIAHTMAETARAAAFAGGSDAN